MTAAALLADLRHRDVVLFVEGGRLRYRGPRGAMTDADRAAVVDHRAELLALLGFAMDLEREGEGERIRALFGCLSDEERRRLEDEARAGDPTAAIMLLLALTDAANAALGGRA